jgi:L-aspartate oxidase
MPRPLLSEALRGEGAILRDERGVAFMAAEHPLADLAPRDVVARAISRRLNERGLDHLWLDATAIPNFPKRFPTIAAACASVGLDPTRDWLPVAPAAHYLMGGVVCDLTGATSLPGLYAVGECACSGVHGANRLASNSLSECFVFGARAAEAAASSTGADRPDSPSWRFEPPTAQTREAVWRDAGPRRSSQSLSPLLHDPYPLARLIARAALERRESRGPHRRADHALQDPALDSAHIVVEPDESLRTELWP